MPETCEHCGRTYADALDYDDHACITSEDISYASQHRECHEEVTRRDELQPCELSAVGVRIDSRVNVPYPVCKRHARGPMVPLKSVSEAVRTIAFIDGIEQGREPECTCWPTAPQSWTRYGSAVEGGSTLEPDPDCVKHFPRGIDR